VSDHGLIALFVEPLHGAGIPSFVTGGVASVISGEPRLTRHIDLVIALEVHDVDHAFLDDQCLTLGLTETWERVRRFDPDA
jgi:hypothetical protein